MANGKTAKQYVEAIRDASGFISVAARRLGCSRSSVYNAIAKHPTVAEAVKDARESMTDLAEGKLVKLITDENPTAIIFYLKTQGKARGYIERHEWTGKDGKPIETMGEFRVVDYRKAAMGLLTDEDDNDADAG